MRVRSLVGLLPLIAVANSPDWVTDELPDVTARLRWLQRHRPELTESLVHEATASATYTSLTPIPRDRLLRILRRLFDQDEFLSPCGVRSLSAAYRAGADIVVAGQTLPIRYDPGEGTTRMFGGNSNWRGPVWFPVNVLEVPTGSGTVMGLAQAADLLDDRLIALFRPARDGRRPSAPATYPDGPLWDHPTFSEYFHADTGIGLGASHQTGWTALVAHLICLRGDREG